TKTNTMKLFLSISFLLFHIMSWAQSKSFVPLDYEYPPAILHSPKTFVFKNAVTSELSFKDISLVQKPDSVIVIWKEYGGAPLIDSCVEVNDKGKEHYLIINGNMTKAIIIEDSLYDNGSKLGEKKQSLYFNINSSLTFSAAIRSSFLKDTSIIWKGEPVPCLVIRSDSKLIFSNPQNAAQQREDIFKTLYYFGKNVGLIKYSSERNGKFDLWELQEIRNLK